MATPCRFRQVARTEQAQGAFAYSVPCIYPYRCIEQEMPKLTWPSRHHVHPAVPLSSLPMTMSCFGRVPVFAGARGIDVVAQASVVIRVHGWRQSSPRYDLRIATCLMTARKPQVFELFAEDKIGRQTASSWE